MTTDITIRRNIENFNNFVMTQDLEKMPVGLFKGKMGLSIYFYYQARFEGSKKYEKFAGELLDSIFEQIHDVSSIDLESGLTGVCWGISHLIENEFVKGNPNYILKELDDKIYNSLCFDFLTDEASDTALEKLKVMVHCSLYLCKRLESRRISVNEKILLERVIIEIINKVETTFETNKMVEPFPFSFFSYFPFLYLKLIEKVYKLGFYTYKIEKVLDEWSDCLLSTYPLLQAHRLLLLSAMKGILKYRKMSHWEGHIKLLEEQTDLAHIIFTEFRDKNILLRNGLAGFYLFAKEQNVMTTVLEEEAREKLMKSKLWSDFTEADNKEKPTYLGLIDGLGGVILVSQL